MASYRQARYLLEYAEQWRLSIPSTSIKFEGCMYLVAPYCENIVELKTLLDDASSEVVWCPA